MRASALRGILAFVLFGAVFTWGFLSHRNRIFPYRIAQAVAHAGMGLLGMPPPISVAPVEARPSRVDRDRLEALGYLGATYDPKHEQEGVLLHQADLALPGLNLYCSGTSASAQLIDMNGTVVHSWAHAADTWQHVELQPGGGLLVIQMDKALVRLDRSSNVVWTARAPVHHDLWVEGDRIYALTREPRLRPDIHPTRKILEEFVAVFNARGEELDSWSLHEVVERSPYSFLIPAFEPKDYADDGPPLDLLHANHVAVLDGRLAHRSPIYARGNILISCRNINSIFIVDGLTKEIVWLWGPSNLTLQHHPSLLPSGNILVFDNGTVASRVVELDPLAGRIVWTYEEEGFFSPTRGSAQRLSNGNTLVTESDSGYAFEVTPTGETVWSYANPDVTEAGERSPIWRMERVDPGWWERIGRSSAAPPMSAD